MGQCHCLIQYELVCYYNSFWLLISSSRQPQTPLLQASSSGHQPVFQFKFVRSFHFQLCMLCDPVNPQVVQFRFFQLFLELFLAAIIKIFIRYGFAHNIKYQYNFSLSVPISPFVHMIIKMYIYVFIIIFMV